MVKGDPNRVIPIGVEIRKTEDAVRNCLTLLVSGSLTVFQRQQIRCLARQAYYLGILKATEEYRRNTKLMEGFDDDEEI